MEHQHRTGGTRASLTDPVCGMKVSEQSTHQHEFEGATYYFCSAGCREKFRADAHKYLHPAPSEPVDTALVETNSRMDEAIFEEFKGTGNMELRLDRRLAERRIYPAIDVDASSTRHEELLFDRKQLQMVWKLRRVLSGLAADGNAAPGLELLIDRLKTFRTNDEFLNEIAKQPTM